MAIVKFPKKELEKHFKIDEKMLDRISMFGCPSEFSGDDIEVEIFPNRPDLISMQGFIRAIEAFEGKNTGIKKYNVQKPEKNYKVKIDSSVKNIRPYTTCAIIKGLKLDDEKIKEIVNFQEKIHSTLGRNRKKLAIGIYPLEKINLPIKYEARKPENIKFTPLGFSREMNAGQILRATQVGREYSHLLKEKEKYPVFVDANSKIMSLPPIINSDETGKITKNTKNIFIECSGSDLNILNKTLNILVTSLAEMGGKIFSMKLEYGKNIITPNLDSEKIKISIENVNKILGLDLKEKDLSKLLEKMGMGYNHGQVEVPAWRTDILHEVDIIEDIAIAFGYENLVPEIPSLSTTGEESNESKLKRKISDLLIGLQFIEVSSYHMIKKEEAKKMKIKSKIEVENSKTDYKFLRPNLLIPILRTLSENKDNEYPQKIFEIGKVFNEERNKENNIIESEKLVIGLTPGNFTEIKQILEYLERSLNLNFELSEDKSEGLIEGRTGKIMLEKKEIGYFGEMHPEYLKKWNLKMPLAILEIKLEEIFDRLSNYN
jgi:phenylalanyl-tRNA synthetase beta chain